MRELIKQMQSGEGQAGEGRLVFAPVRGQGLSRSIEQILDAMLGGGMDGDGTGGFGVYGRDVGLYGPDMQLARQPLNDGRGPTRVGVSATGTGEAAGDATDPDLPRPTGAPRVRLQRNVKFPLRYRRLVGEYFRTVAESQQ